MYIFIGLDKVWRVVYHSFMNKIAFSQKSREITKNKNSKGELVNFVADQFKKLAKKNLRVPIQLYHL